MKKAPKKIKLLKSPYVHISDLRWDRIARLQEDVATKWASTKIGRGVIKKQEMEELYG